jgi:quercetin dioxygenase-like cupin family protein
MYQVIPAGEQQRSPATFEGESHGSGVSFFLVNNEPGQGPDLHRHPYSETWIVRAEERGSLRTAKTSRRVRATSQS